MTKLALLDRIRAYKMGEINWSDCKTAVDAYSSALLQQTPCTTQSVPTDEQIDEIWEERNSSGTYLEGNLCRREGAKKIRDMMLGVA